MNILYIADPNSIHDIKWMSFFTQEHKCYLLVRQHHHLQTSRERYDELRDKYNIHFIEAIEDFSIRRFVQTYRTQRRIGELVRQYTIDLMHIQYAEPNALWAFFHKQIGVKQLLTTRGTDVLQTIPAFYKESGLIKRMAAYCYTKAFQNFDYITGTSSRQIKSLQAFSKSQKPTSIIRTGVNVEALLEDTSAYALDELKGEKYIFFPRAMRPLYQHELAVNALEYIPENIKQQYKFVFVNKDSKDKTYTHDIAQRMQDMGQEHFIWLDNLNQKTLFETYKNASLVVMTPQSDGTPVTGIETFLSKTPLILPPLEYDEDIFKGQAYHFKEWSSQSVAQEIRAVLSQPVEESRIKRAYAKAIELADRKKEMHRLGKIYLQLSQSKDNGIRE